ncbi:SULT2A1 [Branchiostoma lanceolatum]|uniref:Sulfotransferase n=1 Tax=Branchiostoma lanceolatum TaxID=7740 RepID=A0A8K0EDC2_BRALA|nr:SULT2A1 [Branchiostoma lanceolatum]
MSQLRNVLWTHQGLSLPHNVTKETLDVLPGFQIRNDDVVVASYPKTGTNWLIEIVVKILRASGKTKESVDTMTVGAMELRRPTASQPGYVKLAELLSPRLLITHLPIQFAPKGISKPQNKVKVLVPMRNPKDTAVSMFHFSKEIVPMLGGNAYDLRWEDFVQDYSAGIVPYGDFCDHVSGWWQMRDDPHFLFLKYEDMKKLGRQEGTPLFKVDTTGILGRQEGTPLFKVDTTGILGRQEGTPLLKADTTGILGRQEGTSLLKADTTEILGRQEGTPLLKADTTGTLGRQDLLSAVKTIVTFLEVDLDESTVKGIAEASTFNNMKPDLDNAAAAERRHIARKGIVGDWKNYFSTEESEAFDAWCEKKLGGAGLTFDFE